MGESIPRGLGVHLCGANELFESLKNIRIIVQISVV